MTAESQPTADREAGRRRLYYPEIFIICFAALLLEISYTRIFSFKFLYFFTYLAIGVSLMGLGSGGVAVALMRKLREIRMPVLIGWLCTLGGVSILAGHLGIAYISIDTLDLMRSVAQPVLFAATCAMLFVPFFCIGALISRILAAAPERSTRLYLADLAGAALGCSVAVPLIMTITPPGCVMVAGLALTAATFRSFGVIPLGVRLVGVLVMILCAAFAINPSALPEQRVAKGKSDTPGAVSSEIKVVYSDWGPIFRVDVIESTSGDGIERLFLLHDGLPGSGIVKFQNSLDDMRFLADEAASIPFATVRPQPRVMIIGAAGGHEIVTALYHDASHVTGVELNPVTVDILTNYFADFAGRIHEHPKVDYIEGEGRSYITRDTERYDLIYFVHPDSYSASNAATSSAFVLSESYLYTREMIEESLEHLTDDGMICMQMGEFAFDSRPNRTLRFLSTARAACERLGITDFDKHVLVGTTRGFINESFVLLKRTPVTAEEATRFSDKMAAIQGGATRHTWLKQQPASAVGRLISMPRGEVDAWLAAQPYAIGPVTDNSPFFWHFARYSDILFGLDRRDDSLIKVDPEEGLGERVLLFAVAFCGLFALLLLLMPFVVIRSTWKQLPHKGAASIYFGCLGIGFMAYEICLIQKFTLFLGYPTYSLTVTLMTMLVFAGLGSLIAEQYRKPGFALGGLFLVMVGMTLFYQFGAVRVFDHLIGLSLASRIAITILLLAPLSFCMGAFMPLGLRAVSQLSAHGTEYVAWGWAINGFFSVISALLTTILSMSYGFRLVLFMSLCLYALATVLYTVLSRKRVTSATQEST